MRGSSPDFVQPVGVERTFAVVEPLVNLVVDHDGAPGRENVTFTVSARHLRTSGAIAVSAALVSAFTGRLSRFLVVFDPTGNATFDAPVFTPALDTVGRLLIC
jgi:hypothetical protein